MQTNQCIALLYCYIIGLTGCHSIGNRSDPNNSKNMINYLSPSLTSMDRTVKSINPRKGLFTAITGEPKENETISPTPTTHFLQSTQMAPLRQSNIQQLVENVLLRYTILNPKLGAIRIARLLLKQCAINLDSTQVQAIWKRYGLTNKQKRLGCARRKNPSNSNNPNRSSERKIIKQVPAKKLSPKIVKEVAKLAILHPDLGAVRVARQLASKQCGTNVDSAQVQAIWKRYGLTNRTARWRASQRTNHDESQTTFLNQSDAL